MWDNKDSSSGSIMGVLFIIIVIWAIFGGGFGNGVGRNDGNKGCGCITNCEVQKQEIIDSARTQYLIETSANRSIEAANMNTQRLYDQSARQYEAGLQETIFDSKLRESTVAVLNANALSAKDNEIALLRSQMYADKRFDNVEKHLYEIECNTPKRPPYFSNGFIPCGQSFPTNSCC